MSKALAIVNQQTPSPKKKREKICLIETPPEADWFVPSKTKRGRQVWYLRFRMTGLNARLYGPFKSKRQCVLFVEDAINEFHEVEYEIENRAIDRIIKEPFAKVWLPLVEHPTLRQSKLGSSKGSDR